jgi:electron transfer DM13
MTATRAPLAPKLLSVPAVALLVVAGVWISGGVISNDFRLSMILTAAWFAISGLACLAIAVRRRDLRVPVLAAYVVTAAALGLYLGLATLRDRVVDETVVAGAPVARGDFRSGEHHTEGSAAVVRVRDGARYLTLTSFATSAGPDLRVRLVRGRSDAGGAEGAIDLGGLKGNRGDQQYRLPANASIDGATVVIWCRAFSVPFGSARLA